MLKQIRKLMKSKTNNNSTKRNIKDTFLAACESSNLINVKDCLVRGVDVNCMSEDGKWFGLKYAVSANHEELLELLLSNPNIDVNTGDSNGETALMIACKKGFEKIAKRLLEVPDICVNGRSKDGNWFALKYAVSKDNLKILNLLLSHHKIDVNNRDAYNFTALMLSCYEGHSEITKRLIDVPHVNVNCKSLFGNTAAMLAVIKNQVQCLKVLTKCDQVDWNIHNDYELSASMITVWGRREESLSILTTVQSINWNDKNSDGDSPFILALKHQKSAIAQILLSIPNLNIDVRKLDNVYERYWSFQSRNQVKIMSQRSVLSGAVEECRMYVAVAMKQNRDTGIQENVTELVYALKNNLDNIAKVLILATSNLDVLCLVLHLSQQGIVCPLTLSMW